MKLFNDKLSEQLYIEIRRKATSAVSIAVAKGDLVRPFICEGCTEVVRHIVGHHESYQKEKWLDVVWCCQSCHTLRHRMISRRVRRLLNDMDIITDTDYLKILIPNWVSMYVHILVEDDTLVKFFEMEKPKKNEEKQMTVEELKSTAILINDQY